MLIIVKYTIFCNIQMFQRKFHFFLFTYCIYHFFVLSLHTDKLITIKIMDKNTKQTLLNGFESLMVSFYYSSLFGIAFILIISGLGVHIENVILILFGCWMLFMLIEIMWVRCKSQIREMLNEKNK